MIDNIISLARGRKAVQLVTRLNLGVIILCAGLLLFGCRRTDVDKLVDDTGDLVAPSAIFMPDTSYNILRTEKFYDPVGRAAWVIWFPDSSWIVTLEQTERGLRSTYRQSGPAYRAGERVDYE